MNLVVTVQKNTIVSLAPLSSLDSPHIKIEGEANLSDISSQEIEHLHLG